MDYVVQVQHQMAVMGWDYVELPVLFKDTDDFRVYRVERSEKLIDQIIEAEGDLAEKILNGIEPDPDYGHNRTRMLLTEIYGAVVDEVTDLADLEDAVAYRKQLAADKSEITDEIKMIDNKILDSMQTAKYGRAGEHKVTRVKIKESKWTEKDIEMAKEKLGQTKRRGSVSLRFSFFASE
jgi:predicted phage-related endonuclease